jgi:hypothetical protein
VNFSTQHRSTLFFFALLFLAHGLASMSFFPTATRQWLWIGGTLAAFLWLKTREKEQVEPLFNLESKEKNFFPHWAWALLIALGILLRSLRFWAFPHWPLLDEASIIQGALELNRHWDWKFFYTEGQIPPLLIWATAILLKFPGNSFFALVFPAFSVSCLTLLAGFWASRRFLPETLAFLCTAFLAFAYWPVYLLGLSLQASCLPVWEIGVFFLLAETLKKSGNKSDRLWFFALGSWVGLGYWTYTSWPVVAMAALSIALVVSMRKERDYRIPLVLGAGLITTGFYFGIAALQSGGYGTHLAGYSVFHGWISGKQTFFSALDYVNFLFWGYWSRGSYVPDQGGFLNPIMAAFFWMGIGEIFGGPTLPRFTRCSGPVFFLFLLPGLLSQNLQGLRVIQVIPLALGLSALGACRFLSSLPVRGRPVFLGLLLSATFIWDAARLKATMEPLTSQTTQIRMVYGVLEKIARDRGPGMILTQFKAQTHPQQGLSVHPEENLAGAVFPFNAAENSSLDLQRAQWAVLLLHPDEVSFLREDFPGAQWWNPPVSAGGDGELTVGLIPIVAKEGPRLEKWVEADRWLQKGHWEFLDVANAKTYQEAVQYWLHPPPFMAEDRFLQACYWERLAEFYYYRGFETHYDFQVDALKRAVTEGYPAAHLYYDLGCLLLRKGNDLESRRALENALRLEPNNPDIQNALRLLGEMKNQKSSHS